MGFCSKIGFLQKKLRKVSLFLRVFDMRYLLTAFLLWQISNGVLIHASTKSDESQASATSESPDSAQLEQSAKEIVMHVYQQAKAICAHTSKSDAQKIQELKSLVQSHFGMNMIAKVAIHPHWKNFTADQKEHFIELLTNNMVTMFYKMARRYLSHLKILKITPIKNKSRAFNIACEAHNRDDNRKVNFRFQLVGGKVRNILIDNPDGSRGSIDVVNAIKTDYARLMRKNGSHADPFLKALEGLYGEKGTHSVHKTPA
jgi:ABC-type transporter MlaC component